MFEDFSERSLRVVFLARMGAGRRGAASLEPVDLLDAVVREDQGEMAAKFPGAVTSSGPLQPPEREAAEEAGNRQAAQPTRIAAFLCHASYE